MDVISKLNDNIFIAFLTKVLSEGEARSILSSLSADEIAEIQAGKSASPLSLVGASAAFIVRTARSSQIVSMSSGLRNRQISC